MSASCAGLGPQPPSLSSRRWWRSKSSPRRTGRCASIRPSRSGWSSAWGMSGWLILRRRSVYGAADFYRPATVSELRGIVARAGQIRVLATGHSFNDMADSPGAQVNLADLPPEVEVDSAAGLVLVAAGLSYAQVASRLDAQGFALRNLASLPHISVAGACATGTHGSGPANQNLAASITALEIVTADGDLVEIARAEGSFPGAVVHLGALGVVTRLVLEVVPSFDVSQWVYEGLPLEVLDDHFDGIMSSGYSVSM